jgi:capsular polysaccharide transport system permease protein
MTTTLKASRFRIRKPETPAPAPQPAGPEALFDQPEDGFGAGPFPTAAPANQAESPPDTELDAIRREGLTGRQLRLARRMAQLHGLPATSDFDAVRLLRAKGLNPFDRRAVVDIVEGTPVAQPAPAAAAQAAPAAAKPSTALTPVAGDGVKLPQTVKPIQVPSTEVRAETNHAAELMRMQADLVRRRRRRSLLLMVRLMVFVLLPTFIAGYYYYMIATPMYETKSAFIIQQADGAVTAGGPPAPGGLFGGMVEANKEASGAQDLLQSRDGLKRLNEDHNFIDVFSRPEIDTVQRLPDDATFEDAYSIYQRMVKVSYDPTEGLIRLSVLAPDPNLSVEFTRALIGYAEEEIDKLSRRKREDQMEDAMASYTDAEAKLLEAQQKLVALQEQSNVLNSEVEVQLISTQIGQLETQLSTDRLSLAQMEANENPNEARMDPIRRRIEAVEAEIAILRSRMTEGTAETQSLAQVQGELLVAAANVETRQLMLSSTLQQLETARIEANRQVRYLAITQEPIAQDEAAYPRAFENTVVAMLIFSGIYLMIAMTAAILREQVAS